MDNKFTLLIKEWLETPSEKRDYKVGALYLLKLSGNRVMYMNIVSNINRHRLHVEHKLQKYYDFRVQSLTHAQVAEMAAKAEQIAEERKLDSRTASDEPQSAKGGRVGKRDDHDSLPDEIQAMYVENLSLLRRMRELHLKLRTLSLENATCPDSERYPFLKELIELDKKMHKNWETYDKYGVTPPITQINCTDKEKSKH